jgi:hypothetical protein
MMAAWNYLIELVAGDIIEMYWASADINMSIISETAQTIPFTHPAIQSTILTVTQQSGIMAGTGITALNSLTGSVQTMVTGTTGTDFGIASTGTSHTFNLPTASAINRGALSSANWTTFNNKQNAITLTTTGSSGSSTLISNTLNIPTYTLSGLLPTLTSGSVLFSDGSTISQNNSNFFWDNTNNRLGIGTTSPLFTIHSTGSIRGNALYAAASATIGGTTLANASSVLEMISTTKGFLPTRMTTTQRIAIASPAEGLIVYDLTLHKLYLFNGTVWQQITSL